MGSSDGYSHIQLTCIIYLYYFYWYHFGSS